MKICKTEGCENKHFAKGYCQKHYMQKRMYGKILNRTIKDRNEIITKDDIAQIVLYNIKCKKIAKAIIDIEDIKLVEKYKWHSSESRNGKLYVEAHQIKSKKKIKLHILIAGKIGKNLMVDHKDRNPLNNRKNNLRTCSNSNNLMNRSKQKNNRSGYKGVFWDKTAKRWVAAIQSNKKNIFLGRFKIKEQAAEMYNEAAKWFHGEFAYLNKIERIDNAEI